MFPLNLLRRHHAFVQQMHPNLHLHLHWHLHLHLCLCLCLRLHLPS